MLNLSKVRQDLEFNTQDYWAGKAMRISKGNSEDERTTDAIIAARYLRVRYLEKPNETFDPLHRYSSEDFYWPAWGFPRGNISRTIIFIISGSSKTFPSGKVFGITGGFQLRNPIGRAYAGPASLSAIILIGDI